MALFSKKLSLDEILKAIEGLSDEEKAQVKAKMEEDAPTKETPEVDNAQEPSDNEVTEQGAEEGQEPVNEVEPSETSTEEPTGELEEPTKQPAETPNPEGEIQPETKELNGLEQDNKDEVISGLTDRISALEEKLAQFDELKALMEQFTKKQADSFGYKGAIPGAKKDIHEMSASELKEKMLNGEI